MPDESYPHLRSRRKPVPALATTLFLLISLNAVGAYLYDSVFSTQGTSGGLAVREPDAVYVSNTEGTAKIALYIEGVEVLSADGWTNPLQPEDSFQLTPGVHTGPRGVALDSNGHVYVSAYAADRLERTILVYDSELNPIHRLILDTTSNIDYRVYGIALDGAGRLYVLYYSPNHNTERVKVFDATSNWSLDFTAEPLTTLDIALEGSPAHEGICVNREGTILWISSRATRTVERYTGDTTSGFAKDNDFQIDLPDQSGWQGFKGMALSLDETRLFVADDTDGAEQILILDASTGAILPESFSTLQQGRTNPFDVALDSQGNVYVAQYLERRVEKYVWQENPPTPTPTPVDQPVKPEVRALWVTRWDYTTPAHVISIMTNARQYNFNLILFQVRGNATAFYQSAFEPWAWELTGSNPSTLGTDPGWDPLSLACTEAHARDLELHAWVNVFPAWKETIPPPSGVNQIWNTHQEWIMQNQSGDIMWPQGWWDYWYTFVDPGVPQVKSHLHDVFLEIVSNYAVDGLHYDYVRYPSEVGDWAYNTTSVTRFETAYGGTPQQLPAEWAQWKRDQVTEIVASVYPDAESVNRKIKITAAGISSYSSAYNTYSQDYRKWLSDGVLDAVIPMLYIQNTVTFRSIVRDQVANQSGRWIVPGLGAHNTDTSTLLDLIQISREEGAAGVAVFAYSSLFPNHTPNAKADAIRNGPFPTWVPVPEMDWKQQPVQLWRVY